MLEARGWRRPRHWPSKALGLVACWLVCLLHFAPGAAAHVGIELEGLRDGQRLTSAPESITIAFSEPVERSTLHVAINNHRQYDVALDSLDINDIGDKATAELPEGVPDGSYLIDVRATGSDGHSVGQQFVFVVGDGPLIEASGALSGQSGQSSGVLSTLRLADAVTNLSLVALAIPFVLMICWPEGFGRKRILQLIKLAVVAGIAGAVGAYLVQGPYTAGGTLQEVLDPELLTATWATPLGKFLVVRIACLSAFLIVLDRLSTGDRAPDAPLPWQWENAAILIGCLILLSAAGTSHAAGDEWALVTLLIGAAHLGAILLWCGGVLTWFLLLLRGTARQLPVQAIQRFGPLAKGCVAAAVGTGILLSVRLTDGFQTERLLSPYGAVLGIKLVLVGYLLFTALGSHRQVQALAETGRAENGPGLRRLRKLVSLEQGLAALVILTAGYLSSVA